MGRASLLVALSALAHRGWLAAQSGSGLARAAGAAALEPCVSAANDGDEVCSVLQLSGKGAGAQSLRPPAPPQPPPPDEKATLGDGQQSKNPDWQACSYADSGSIALCGHKVKLKKGCKVQYRWLYPNASFGEVDGEPVYLQDEGIEFSTRVTINKRGVVTSSKQFDFTPIEDFTPLKGWRVEGLPPGTYNLNACPITYGDAACAPARAMPQYQGGEKVKVILDSDVGVFMDDPFAIAFAAVSDRLDLQMVITTSRNTSQSAYIAAKLLWAAGRPDVEVNAGHSQAPNEEQLMAQWALQPPAGSNLSDAQWYEELSRMVKTPETNSAATPLRVQALIEKLRSTGEISPERPLVYWLTGPVDSSAKVQELLSAEEKACVFLIAMGGSIVDGFPFQKPSGTRGAPGQDRGGGHKKTALMQNRLAFGPNKGMSPWPETNVKGDDAIDGDGTDVKQYKAMVQDPSWAAMLLSTSEPVCDAQPGIGNGTALAWERFKVSTSPGAAAIMDMMYAWTAAAREQCQGEDAKLRKCACATEASSIAAEDYRYAPAQCDVMSIMPWLHPTRFGIEPMYLDFTTAADEVRGCALQVPKPEGGRCISVVTYYKPPTEAYISRGDVTLEEGSKSRDFLVDAFLSVIETA